MPLRFNKLIKIIFLNFLLIILFALLITDSTYAQNYPNWQINSFSSEIYLNQDGSLDITEIINVTFNVEKHGIYRFIPIKYKDGWGNNLRLKIDVKSVVNEKNQPYKIDISNEKDNFKIRIGDPYITLTGNHTYKINYLVNKALVWGKNNQDEIYWNITGNDWEVPINNVKGKIILPQEINSGIETYCWSGQYGSQEKNCQIKAEKNIINFQSKDFLTVAVKFPVGFIHPPSWKQEIIWLLEDNWLFFLPIISLILMSLLWYIKGREPKGRGTIVVEFEPPDDLRPTEVGLLLDNKIQNKEITATIIDLAVRKYIKIIEKKVSRYELALLKKDFINDPQLKNYEKTILRKIFPPDKEKIDINDLEDKFYRNLPIIIKEVTQDLVKNGYYQNNPSTIRKISITFLIVFLIIGILMIGTRGIGGLISFSLSGLIIFIFGLKMINKSQKGIETLEKIEGFKLYIKTAEKYRIKFQENANIFERVLPYAIIFNLANKWAKVFKDIYKGSPSWYESQGKSFNSINFISAVDAFNSKLEYNISSRPSSSPSSGSGSGGSSGFSGGGFGGGGGGSW